MRLSEIQKVPQSNYDKKSVLLRLEYYTKSFDKFEFTGHSFGSYKLYKRDDLNFDYVLFNEKIAVAFVSLANFSVRGIPNTKTVLIAGTDPTKVKQGIMTWIYLTLIEKEGINIVSDRTLTPAAQKLWYSLMNKVNVYVYYADVEKLVKIEFKNGKPVLPRKTFNNNYSRFVATLT